MFEAKVPERESVSTSGLSLKHMMFLVVLFALVFWIVAPAVQAGEFPTLRSLIVMMVVLLVVALPGLVVGWIIVLFQRRSSRQQGLLWILSIAVSRGMPLGPAVTAFADQYSGWFRLQVQALGRLLDEGSSLSSAVKRLPGLLPADARLLIRTGEHADSLDVGLNHAAESRSRRQPVAPVLGRLFYILVILLQVQLMMGFILYVIVPKFEAIFNDFGVALPRVTTWVISLSHKVTNEWIGFVLVIGQLATLIIILLLSAFGRKLGVSWFSRYFPRLAAPLVLRCLALETRGGKTLAEGLVILASDFPVEPIRRRLTRARDRVLGGSSFWTTLRAEHLLPPQEQALLEAAERVGNLPWALEELADSLERRISYKIQLVTLVLFPLAVIGLGLLVFLYAVAFFAPLVQLIASLA